MSSFIFSDAIDPIVASASDLRDAEMDCDSLGASPVEMNLNHRSDSNVAFESLYKFILAPSTNSILGSTTTALNFDGNYPEGSLQKYGEDRWVKEKPNFDSYVRNQSRPENKKLDLNELKSLLPALEGNSRYWFHATGWESADKKRQFGPIMSEGKLDVAIGRAFYLNPHYDDSCEWLFKKNSVYRGQHAILIYRFALADLDGRGKELGLAEWQSVARQWSTVSCPDAWTYTFQNSDPKNVGDPKRSIKPRQMNNGKDAMQLIIRTKELCSQIHEHLVGCIFFENLYDTTFGHTPSKPARLKHPGPLKSKKHHRRR